MMLLVVEAIHSVAIEHVPSCGCTVCRAADGDEAAFDQVLQAVYLSPRESRG